MRCRVYSNSCRATMLEGSIAQGSFEFLPRHLILLLMQELDSLANVELSGFKLCLIHFHLQSHIFGVFLQGLFVAGERAIQILCWLLVRFALKCLPALMASCQHQSHAKRHNQLRSAFSPLYFKFFH